MVENLAPLSSTESARPQMYLALHEVFVTANSETRLLRTVATIQDHGIIANCYRHEL